MENKIDSQPGAGSLDSLVGRLRGDLPMRHLGFDLETGNVIMGLDRKQLLAQQHEAASVIEALRDALLEIAEFYSCYGPGCHWCESEQAHPQSAEARIASGVLDGISRPTFGAFTSARETQPEGEDDGK